jgi:hypothetical protein
MREHQEEGRKRERFWCSGSPKGTRQPSTIGSPVGGPHSLGEIRGAAAVNVLSRLFAFAGHGGALGWGGFRDFSDPRVLGPQGRK